MKHKISRKTGTGFVLALMPCTLLAGEADLTADSSAALHLSSPESVLAGSGSTIRLAVSPDGSRELWGEVRAPEDGGLEIRQREKSAAGWGEPEDVPFNTQWNDFDPAFTPDGSGVYYFSNRPGGEGGDDIWFVPLQDGVWGEPFKVDPPVNTPGNEWAPTPLPDGRLLFSSDGHGGFGAQDLYVAERNARGWNAPQNLGAPVNSDANDYDAVFLDDDVLVFTRSGEPMNGSELVYSCRSDAGYTEPVSAGPNVNLGGGWALGPSVSERHPGVLFFSGRDAEEQQTHIYRVRYDSNCSTQ